MNSKIYLKIYVLSPSLTPSKELLRTISFSDIADIALALGESGSATTIGLPSSPPVRSCVLNGTLQRHLLYVLMIIHLSF